MMTPKSVHSDTLFPLPSPLTREWVLGLLAICLLGLVVRWPGVASHSYWYDEAVTQQILQHNYAEMVCGIARDNGNPPGYWIVARCWQQWVASGDEWLRGLSVLCGVLTVVAVGFLGRLMAGSGIGLGAAAIYAVSPLAVEFANEARTYALLQLVSVVNAWFFIRVLNANRFLDWAGYTATMFLAWYSHYYAAFLPLTHALVLLAMPWSFARWIAWLAAMSLAAALWATWLPTFVTQLTTPGNLTRSADTWRIQFLATPVTYSVGRSFAWRDSPKALIGLAAFGTLIAFLIPAILGTVRLWRWKPAIVLLLAWVLLPVVLPLIVALLYKPIYSHRYAAIGLPAFAILVAAGYAFLRPGPRWAIAALAVSLTIVSLYRYSTEPLKDDWRSATPAILSRLDSDRMLIFDTAIEVVSFQHYAGPSQPRDAIGLDTTLADGHAFPGVRYLNGNRIDPVARDYAPELFAADRICLVLCVPGRPERHYTSLFHQRGYVISNRDTYHRIRILYLDRVGKIATRD